MVVWEFPVPEGGKIVHSNCNYNPWDAAIGQEPSRESVWMHGEFHGGVVKVVIDYVDWLQSDKEQLLPTIFQIFRKTVTFVDRAVLWE